MNTTLLGAKGTITDIDQFISHLTRISEQYKAEIQIIDAALVYGKNHLHSAATHAQRAFKEKRNSCNTLAMELMLYVSGERQIQKALSKIGIKPTTTEYAFVILSDKKTDLSKVKKEIVKNTSLRFTDDVLEGSQETMKHWGFTRTELQTVPEYKYSDLILEKVALVDVIKK